MKKLIILAIVLTFCVQAQGQGSKWGTKFGANIAQLNQESGDSYSSRTAFYLGLAAEFPVSSIFSVQPELIYSPQGATYEGVFENEPSDIKLKLAYLNMPLLGKLFLSENLSVEAGPQIGYLLSAKRVPEGNSNFDGVDISEDLKDLDIGLNFGASYQIEQFMYIQARYLIGMTDINQETDSTISDPTKHGIVQAGVGFKF